MRDRRLADADRLAAEGQLHSKRGAHAEATRVQRLAVDLCQRVLSDLLNASEEDIPTLPRDQREAAHDVADHLGRLGGAYRRAGELRSAKDAYRRGADLEREWHLDDTYCRTNAIVLQVLEDPTQLPWLMQEIMDVAALIRHQVDGPRRRQWWAWADLGLLNLLAGREREAMWAYNNYVGAAPRRVDSQSTLAVLREVRNSVAQVESSRIGSFDSAIALVDNGGTT